MTEPLPHDRVPVLAARQASLAYDTKPVIAGLNLDVEAGSIVALVGPNGSGKSTALRAFAGLLAPTTGVVQLDGSPITSQPRRHVARRLAVLPQHSHAPAAMTVHELVTQGRYAHLGPLRPASAADRDAVNDALELTGTMPFAHRPVSSLSGGERQRVWIALTIAQQARTLLLDEPTTFLDVGHQLEVLDLIARLRDDRNLTVVIVLHHLDHAARYADRIVALHEGSVAADGQPHEIITPKLLADVFHVRATVIADPELGCPVCLVHAPLNGTVRD